MDHLPQRKRIRLQGYDYSQNGAYFITICTKNRAEIFGSVNGGFMALNQMGEIASRHIKEIKSHIVGVTVANYVVMPNHIHMILVVDTPTVGPRYIVADTRIAILRGRKTDVLYGVPTGKIQTNIVADTQTPHIVAEKRTSYMASLREKSKQTVPKAIQQFKASVSRETQTIGLWQPRYHDHIIRNEQEYQKIWEYIEINPLRWEADCFYGQG